MTSAILSQWELSTWDFSSNAGTDCQGLFVHAACFSLQYLWMIRARQRFKLGHRSIWKTLAGSFHMDFGRFLHPEKINSHFEYKIFSLSVILDRNSLLFESYLTWWNLCHQNCQIYKSYSIGLGLKLRKCVVVAESELRVRIQTVSFIWVSKLNLPVFGIACLLFSQHGKTCGVIIQIGKWFCWLKSELPHGVGHYLG